MLVHEKPREINKTTATELDRDRNQTTARSDQPEVERPVRRPWQRGRVAALALTGVVMVIAIVALLAWPSSDPGSITTSDGSFETAETNRFNRLAPTETDGSSQTAETNRFNRLAPTETDGSSQTAEASRFAGLAPTKTDGSSQTAETNRFNRLAPTTDQSHHIAETNRFVALRRLISP